jgi:hypothetical protein
MRKWLFIIVIYFSILTELPLLFSQCSEISKNFSHERLGEPILWGKPYWVPQIRLRVTDRSTSKGLREAKVIMRYMWKHFRLPYFELENGKWDQAYDVITCMTDDKGIVQFPEYNVLPRGWYAGDKLRSRFPEFVELEVSYEMDHFWISKKQLNKIRESLKNQIELKRPDGFVPPIKMEIVP